MGKTIDDFGISVFNVKNLLEWFKASPFLPFSTKTFN
jgi:hypothetical protein